nr:hypothetical protein 2 [bacterium]
MKQTSNYENKHVDSNSRVQSTKKTQQTGCGQNVGGGEGKQWGHGTPSDPGSDKGRMIPPMEGSVPSPSGSKVRTGSRTYSPKKVK